MGMSSSVAGIVPADDKFNEMKTIWEMCENSNVAIPQEVIDFFDGDRHDPAGVVVYLRSDLGGAVSEYNNDMQEGFEVDISRLDPKFKIIRFVNSY